MNIYTAQVAPIFTTGSLAAAGAAAVSVPIIIHLLTRFRRKPQTWGAMRFLLEAYRRHRTRLQIEQLLLLLVRCLILAILGLALAGPILTGCASGPLGSLAGSGRVVHLVIDDSLTSQAAAGTGEAADALRFDKLREAATQIVDGLRSGDRVAIWRASRPIEPLMTPASLDHAGARDLLAGMQPRYSGADLPATLVQVNEALSAPEARAAGPEQVFVIVLSDFSRSSLALERPAPAQLSAIAGRARVYLAQPMTEQANVQIESLRPRHHMVVTRGMSTQAAVSMDVALRRFADEAADRVTNIAFSVVGADGALTHVAERQHRWTTGQNRAALTIDLPLADLPVDLSDAAGGAQSLAIRATIKDAGQTVADTLAADNAAWSVVEVRQQVTVGIIDSPGSAGDGGYEPRDWLSIALSPEENLDGIARSGVEEVDLAPAAVDIERLKPFDAVMVLRPDLLTSPGWSALKQFVEQGGLAWFFVPPNGEASSGVWGAKLVEAFDLDWRLGIEPVNAGGNQSGDPFSDPMPGDSAYWALLNEGVVPEPLRLIAAEWDSHLKSIRVNRRLELTVRGGEVAAHSVWLRLDDPNRSPLLASATVGDGRVLMLATALDTQWGNLTARPLWLPLVHAALRGVLGESPQMTRLSSGRTGGKPLLGRDFDSVQKLVLASSLDEIDPASRPSVLLQRTDAGMMPASALDWPGIWAGEPRTAGQVIATNIDADAGDTRALDDDLLQAWFSVAGDVHWLDAKRPAAVFAAEASRLALAWPLLCAVLGLALLETLLARWFSHATVGQTTPKGPATAGQMAAMVRTMSK